MTTQAGVLLVNIGSPDAPDVAGGQSFAPIPALNDQPHWVAASKQLIDAAPGRSRPIDRIG